MLCNKCERASVYEGQPNPRLNENVNVEQNRYICETPIQYPPISLVLSEDIPERTRDVFLEAATCRGYGLNEAAGAMFRKAIDVGTKQFYESDPRLSGKQPAIALRSRIKALGEMNILDDEVVELADIAALDGNDAAHDMDPYTQDEAEALEDLTFDLLDRLFTRPAKIARVRQKQLDSGQRK